MARTGSAYLEEVLCLHNEISFALPDRFYIRTRKNLVNSQYTIFVLKPQNLGIVSIAMGLLYERLVIGVNEASTGIARRGVIQLGITIRLRYINAYFVEH